MYSCFSAMHLLPYMTVYVHEFACVGAYLACGCATSDYTLSFQCLFMEGSWIIFQGGKEIY